MAETFYEGPSKGIGSPSTSRVASLPERNAARWTAVTVFPTPPLKLATVTIMFGSLVDMCVRGYPARRVIAYAGTHHGCRV